MLTVRLEEGLRFPICKVGFIEVVRTQMTPNTPIGLHKQFKRIWSTLFVSRQVAPGTAQGLVALWWLETGGLSS